MAITQLNPYLNYDGTAAQAIALYEKVLGATHSGIRRFGDVPDMPADDEHKDRVMHAELKVGAGTIMISDTPPGQASDLGNNVYVCLNCDNVAEMTDMFNGLAIGGRVTMPLQETFWGATFGIVTDPYGINWMFNGPKG